MIHLPSWMEIWIQQEFQNRQLRFISWEPMVSVLSNFLVCDFPFHCPLALVVSSLSFSCIHPQVWFLYNSCPYPRISSPTSQGQNLWFLLVSSALELNSLLFLHIGLNYQLFEMSFLCMKHTRMASLSLTCLGTWWSCPPSRWNRSRTSDFRLTKVLLLRLVFWACFLLWVLASLQVHGIFILVRQKPSSFVQDFCTDTCWYQIQARCNLGSLYMCLSKISNRASVILLFCRFRNMSSGTLEPRPTINSLWKATCIMLAHLPECLQWLKHHNSA